MSSLPFRSLRGFTLLELIVALVFLGVVAGLASVRLQPYLDTLRVRAALDVVAGEIYRARMDAVERGRSSYLVLRSTDDCVTAVELRVDITDPEAPHSTLPLDAGPVCLRHSGDSILVFNGRGMLLPPARSVFSVEASHADSLLVSIAGRVRRTY